MVFAALFVGNHAAMYMDECYKAATKLRGAQMTAARLFAQSKR